MGINKALTDISSEGKAIKESQAQNNRLAKLIQQYFNDYKSEPWQPIPPKPAAEDFYDFIYDLLKNADKFSVFFIGSSTAIALSALSGSAIVYFCLKKAQRDIYHGRMVNRKVIREFKKNDTSDETAEWLRNQINPQSYVDEVITNTRKGTQAEGVDFKELEIKFAEEAAIMAALGQTLEDLQENKIVKIDDADDDASEAKSNKADLVVEMPEEFVQALLDELQKKEWDSIVSDISPVGENQHNENIMVDIKDLWEFDSQLTDAEKAEQAKAKAKNTPKTSEEEAKKKDKEKIHPEKHKKIKITDAKGKTKEVTSIRVDAREQTLPEDQSQAWLSTWGKQLKAHQTQIEQANKQAKKKAMPAAENTAQAASQEPVNSKQTQTPVGSLPETSIAIEMQEISPLPVSQEPLTPIAAPGVSSEITKELAALNARKTTLGRVMADQSNQTNQAEQTDSSNQSTNQTSSTGSESSQTTEGTSDTTSGMGAAGGTAAGGSGGEDPNDDKNKKDKSDKNAGKSAPKLSNKEKKAAEDAKKKEEEEKTKAEQEAAEKVVQEVEAAKQAKIEHALANAKATQLGLGLENEQETTETSQENTFEEEKPSKYDTEIPAESLSYTKLLTNERGIFEEKALKLTTELNGLNEKIEKTQNHIQQTKDYLTYLGKKPSDPKVVETAKTVLSKKQKQLKNFELEAEALKVEIYLNQQKEKSTGLIYLPVKTEHAIKMAKINAKLATAKQAENNLSGQIYADQLAAGYLQKTTENLEDSLKFTQDSLKIEAAFTASSQTLGSPEPEVESEVLDLLGEDIKAIRIQTNDAQRTAYLATISELLLEQITESKKIQKAIDIHTKAKAEGFHSQAVEAAFKALEHGEFSMGFLQKAQKTASKAYFINNQANRLIDHELEQAVAELTKAKTLLELALNIDTNVKAEIKTDSQVKKEAKTETKTDTKAETKTDTKKSTTADDKIGTSALEQSKLTLDLTAPETTKNIAKCLESLDKTSTKMQTINAELVKCLQTVPLQPLEKIKANELPIDAIEKHQDLAHTPSNELEIQIRWLVENDLFEADAKIQLENLKQAEILKDTSASSSSESQINNRLIADLCQRILLKRQSQKIKAANQAKLETYVKTLEASALSAQPMADIKQTQALLQHIIKQLLTEQNPDRTFKRLLGELQAKQEDMLRYGHVVLKQLKLAPAISNLDLESLAEIIKTMQKDFVATRDTLEAHRNQKINLWLLTEELTRITKEALEINPQTASQEQVEALQEIDDRKKYLEKEIKDLTQEVTAKWEAIKESPKQDAKHINALREKLHECSMLYQKQAETLPKGLPELLPDQTACPVITALTPDDIKAMGDSTLIKIQDSITAVDRAHQTSWQLSDAIKEVVTDAEQKFYFVNKGILSEKLTNFVTELEQSAAEFIAGDAPLLNSHLEHTFYLAKKCVELSLEGRQLTEDLLAPKFSKLLTALQHCNNQTAEIELSALANQNPLLVAQLKEFSTAMYSAFMQPITDINSVSAKVNALIELKNTACNNLEKALGTKNITEKTRSLLKETATAVEALLDCIDMLDLVKEEQMDTEKMLYSISVDVDNAFSNIISCLESIPDSDPRHKQHFIPIYQGQKINDLFRAQRAKLLAEVQAKQATKRTELIDESQKMLGTYNQVAKAETRELKRWQDSNNKEPETPKHLRIVEPVEQTLAKLDVISQWDDTKFAIAKTTRGAETELAAQIKTCLTKELPQITKEIEYQQLKHSLISKKALETAQKDALINTLTPLQDQSAALVMEVNALSSQLAELRAKTKSLNSTIALAQDAVKSATSTQMVTKAKAALAKANQAKILELTETVQLGAASSSKAAGKIIRISIDDLIKNKEKELLDKHAQLDDTNAKLNHISGLIRDAKPAYDINLLDYRQAVGKEAAQHAVGGGMSKETKDTLIAELTQLVTKEIQQTKKEHLPEREYQSRRAMDMRVNFTEMSSPEAVTKKALSLEQSIRSETRLKFATQSKKLAEEIIQLAAERIAKAVTENAQIIIPENTFQNMVKLISDKVQASIEQEQYKALIATKQQKDSVKLFEPLKAKDKLAEEKFSNIKQELALLAEEKLEIIEEKRAYLEKKSATVAAKKIKKDTTIAALKKELETAVEQQQATKIAELEAKITKEEQSTKTYAEAIAESKTIAELDKKIINITQKMQRMSDTVPIPSKTENEAMTKYEVASKLRTAVRAEKGQLSQLRATADPEAQDARLYSKPAEIMHKITEAKRRNKK